MGPLLEAIGNGNLNPLVSNSSVIEKRSEAMIDWASDDIMKVVDAYFHALTSRFPRERYHVGWDSVLFFIPMSMMWTPVQDLAMLLLMKVQNPPQPAGATVKMF